MDKLDIGYILHLLTEKYGHRSLKPNRHPIPVLVQTILSQNTSDKNSSRAYKSLLASFPTWDELMKAQVEEISACIKAGGLGKIKARRIRQALTEIKRRRGRLELDFLNELPLDDARKWLKELPGVGSKTANVILLFAFGKPALPVDTHVFRVAKRLGMVAPQVSVEEAHRLLEELVPPRSVLEFHLLLIEHGRRVCRARRPQCSECVLREVCPSCPKLEVSSNRHAA